MSMKTSWEAARRVGHEGSPGAVEIEQRDLCDRRSALDKLNQEKSVIMIVHKL
jgi:hypothetical protein